MIATPASYISVIWCSPLNLLSIESLAESWRRVGGKWPGSSVGFSLTDWLFKMYRSYLYSCHGIPFMAQVDDVWTDASTFQFNTPNWHRTDKWNEWDEVFQLKCPCLSCHVTHTHTNTHTHTWMVESTVHVFSKPSYIVMSEHLSSGLWNLLARQRGKKQCTMGECHVCVCVWGAVVMATPVSC